MSSEDRTSRNGQRISTKDIKKEFATSISPDNNMATITSRQTGAMILQTRIIRACDPILSMEFMENLAREVLRYQKAAWKDIQKRNS